MRRNMRIPSLCQGLCTRYSSVRETEKIRGLMQKQAMARLPDTAEWPTLGLALGIYTGFGALTWFYQALPWWFVLGAGADTIAGT